MPQTRIDEQAAVGGSPGSPNGAIPATPGTQADLTAPLTQEFVSSGGYAWWAAYAKTLPHYLDDLSTDFGWEIYQSMQRDAVVRAALTVLKASVLEDAVNLAPAVDDPDDPQHDLAATIRDFCDDTLQSLDTPIDAVLWDMLDALALGSRVAEQVYALRPVDGTQRLVLTALKVKPLASTAFVTDSYNNVLGLVAVIPGVGYSLLQNTFIGDLGSVPNLLPREKFAVLSFRPQHGDPRGTSILRSAYQAWWHKMQLWPEYMKYLTQFASPIPVGVAGPDAVAQIDPVTGVQVTPEQTLLAALQGIRNGAAVAVPNGTTVTLHYSPGAGSAFVEAFDHYDRQMTVAILGQTLATGEGRHNARAAAQVHQDILDTLVRQLKQFVVRMIRHDILTPLIAYNWGDAAARDLVPAVSLGETESTDLSKILTALAAIEGFQILPSQLQGIYQMAGLPDADPEEILRIQTAQDAGAQAAQQVAATPPTETTGTIGLPGAGGAGTES